MGFPIISRINSMLKTTSLLPRPSVTAPLLPWLPLKARKKPSRSLWVLTPFYCRQHWGSTRVLVFSWLLEHWYMYSNHTWRTKERKSNILKQIHIIEGVRLKWHTYNIVTEPWAVHENNIIYVIPLKTLKWISRSWINWH